MLTGGYNGVTYSVLRELHLCNPPKAYYTGVLLICEYQELYLHFPFTAMQYDRI